MSSSENVLPQFYNVLEKIDQGAFVTKDFKFLYINPKGQEFFQCKKNRSYEKHFLDFISKDDLSDFVKNNEKVLDSRTTILSLTNNSKRKAWVELSMVPIQWEGEEAVLNLIADITAHKEKEEQLEIAKQKAEEADRLKSSFLANMSHEIRTPLNAIIGFTQLLTQDDIPEDLKEKYYKLIDINSFQLLELIDDIIDLTKVESGELAINKTYFSVNELIKEVFVNFNERNNSVKTDVKTKLKIPIKSSNIFINSDRQRVRQVLNNLFINALKNTKDGLITLGYRIIDRSKIEFYVKDTGIGIQKEKLEKIFNQFYQLNTSRNSNAKGTGLGLAISEKIIELLGGQIYVKSEFGKGAIFGFRLPYKSESITVNDRLPNIKKTIPAYIDWSDKTILLAEDEESNSLFIKEVLKKTRVNILWAKDGEEALNLLESEEQIDLVLLDINMPKIDGYKVFEQIQQKGYNIPVIAQTAYAMIEDRERILSLGFDYYIAKPIQMNTLLETISQFIR